MTVETPNPLTASTRRVRPRAWVYRVFTDRLMTELALLLIPSVLLPLYFTLSPVSVRVCDLVNGVVIVVFTLEYFLKLYVAESRWRFFRDPWHILDLLVVLLAAVDFLPFIPWQGGRASPLLRLLRLARIFALTGRTLRRVTEASRHEEVTLGGPGAEIHILEEGTVKQVAVWADAEATVNEPKETWIDVQNIGTADLDALSRTFRIPRHVLASKLFRDTFPGIDYFKDYTILSLWDTRLVDRGGGPGGLQTENPSVVVICSRDYLATLSVARNDILDHFVKQGLPLPGESFSVRVLYAILRHKIDDYKMIGSALERHVADLEETLGGKPSSRFLDDTFHLKKLIQKQGHNLRHFTQVLDHIRSRKVTLHNLREESADLFVLLHDEGNALHDTCQSIREDLLSLIELQLNKVSFDLNRVMKVLAVISCLSLIPAIIGGLLGENLVDQPYNITLREIFLFVISLMLIGLYIFHRQGWLR